METDRSQMSASGGCEAEPIMVSALEHYSYCPRQCALIHVENVWNENIYTMRGRGIEDPKLAMKRTRSLFAVEMRFQFCFGDVS